ncbi:hypothetical protein A6X21_15935 [Planctopirus hydrillae]|uniref:Uncharacterized protein n=1 Tax=Planctopirus hydrillae TaxID=1841610 RepID=A0A1C3ETL5_9PLAN|nr:hypothetical protein A6X21_15935 [Planctopirus hydrillae]
MQQELLGLRRTLLLEKQLEAACWKCDSTSKVTKSTKVGRKSSALREEHCWQASSGTQASQLLECDTA